MIMDAYETWVDTTEICRDLAKMQRGELGTADEKSRSWQGKTQAMTR